MQSFATLSSAVGYSASKWRSCSTSPAPPASDWRPDRGPEDRLGSGAVAVAEILEDVAHLVGLAALHACRVAARHAQGLRAIKGQEQAAAPAEPATREIRQRPLAHGRVPVDPSLRPSACFLAIGGDAQRDGQTVIAEVHAVDEQTRSVARTRRRAQLSRCRLFCSPLTRH